MADQSVPEVEYRDVVGFPGYRVGSDGTVMSCRKVGIGMTGSWSRINGSVWVRGGYVMMCFKREGDGKPHRKLLHHVVLEAFAGPRPDGLFGCHNDDDPLNNDIGNLRWDTRESNYRDRDANNGTARGERQGLAILNDQKVLQIRELAESGATNKKIAEMFGTTNSNVSEVVYGRTWKHVGGPLRTVSRRGIASRELPDSARRRINR